ncbi:AbrB family looped-hinge helix DNA binding protein [Sphingomonas endophytica]|uniref:AbrB family looped-hinge helix DNA binding protein n=1 Tax=Sphingomonas endophytica TaxID=869719 RepID=A0A7X0MMI9_9SPHN|nr:AbrB/MazE/SpoVT family DNA-binding domain-containing protein [Sphingomonas endophytica]MBB6504707.1 AbrB family looped-hinge helix DNA binding protein [Sphingomonas endophytica]
MTYLAKVIAGGKVVIPAGWRRELGIKDGDSVIFDRDDAGAILVKTHEQVVREVQALFRPFGDPASSIVDELIKERREEQRREGAAAGDRLAS